MAAAPISPHPAPSRATRDASFRTNLDVSAANSLAPSMIALAVAIHVHTLYCDLISAICVISESVSAEVFIIRVCFPPLALFFAALLSRLSYIYIYFFFCLGFGDGYALGEAASAAPPPQRTRDYASFSASLLDAIYRSLDAPETHTEPEPDPAPPPMKPPPPSSGGPRTLPLLRTGAPRAPDPGRSGRTGSAPPHPFPLPLPSPSDRNQERRAEAALDPEPAPRAEKGAGLVGLVAPRLPPQSAIHLRGARKQGQNPGAGAGAGVLVGAVVPLGSAGIGGGDAAEEVGEVPPGERDRGRGLAAVRAPAPPPRAGGEQRLELGSVRAREFNVVRRSTGRAAGLRDDDALRRLAARRATVHRNSDSTFIFVGIIFETSTPDSLEYIYARAGMPSEFCRVVQVVPDCWVPSELTVDPLIELDRDTLHTRLGSAHECHSGVRLVLSRWCRSCQLDLLSTDQLVWIEPDSRNRAGRVYSQSRGRPQVSAAAPSADQDRGKGVAS
uniref:Uncharacterized protein n=1 Tax=Ananas comosus var. bracteatus TaxID=296719 RepID=A0A6V7P928_ANACO|nr:unnamed protein product [Ananas comosus var. bracteatus]